MSGRIDELLHDLNPAQRDAAAHRDGPLLVLAGPGSGKTRVITRRAACLVAGGVRPRNVLCITFTNKAAAEMRRRMESLGVAAGMWVCTFHAMCARLLRELGETADVQPGFTIFDAEDQLRAAREAIERCGVLPAVLRPADALDAISRAKNLLLATEDFAAQARTLEERALAPVYQQYQHLLRQQNALDFDDLLMHVAVLLRDNEAVRERLGARFQYVLIDEYQDTNHAQYLIAKLLARDHRNLCVTGDPDQSIYAWRGADISNILEFERDYPDARVVRLEQNYRSHGNILKAADTLIAGNRRRKVKKLWSELPDGEPVEAWTLPTGEAEAEAIAQAIAEGRAAGRTYGEFAVFYRVNAVSRGLEDALRARRIPYRIARGIAFYGRKEIKDTVAYLRLLVNPADAVALERAMSEPPRGIGERTLQRLLSAAAERQAPVLDVVRRAEEVPGLKGAAAARVRQFGALIERLQGCAGDGSAARAVSEVLKLSGLEDLYRRERDDGGQDRLANVQELVTAAARYDDETESPTLEGFLQLVSLTSDQDRVDESEGVVNLMTLHAAKGLEFPVVFIAAMEEGFLPHERSEQSRAGVEEERRLCFVGMTRAMQRLYLSRARVRLLRGDAVPRRPSRFLQELAGAPIAARPADAHESDHDGEDAWREEADGPTAARWQALGDLRGRLSRRSGARRLGAARDERTFSLDDPTRPLPPAPAANRYADWAAGDFVKHDSYGVGTVLWVSCGGSQTRAGIRFARHGEKVFILELAPVRKLQRRPDDGAEQSA